MTDIEIINKALLKLGQEPIVALTDTNERAILASAIFASVRDMLITSYRWAFATKRTVIEAEENEPAFGWKKKYALPEDFLRLSEICNADFRETDNYEIEGGYILCNYVGPLKIKYLAKITTSGIFPVYFCEALACKLAFEFCERLKQDQSRKQMLMQEFMFAISEAKKCNAIQLATVGLPRGSYNDIREGF